QDANRYLEGWSMPGLNDDDWDRVRSIDLDYSLLQPRRSLPVIIKEKIKPAAIIHTPKGETVLDFGQNMVGWASFRIDAPQGTEVLLQYGEALQDGCFSQENLRSAKAEFTYISDGRPAQVKPCFTFYGFRYVKVEGWVGELALDDFTGHVVYSDLERIGTIETSNPMVNRLFLNALWGQKGNFLDVPTDCPQRDERMGWTGDAQMFSGTACFNMDCDAFFGKFLYDLALEQKRLGGKVPDFVPTFGLDPLGMAAWSDAATVIPWNLYLHYGDLAGLERQLESMIAHVERIKSQDDGDRLWDSGFHVGDWLALDGKGEFSRLGGTPTDLIATAYYAYSAGLVAKAARVLGKEEIAREYEQLAEEVKRAFCEEFVTPRGRMAANTQTAHILPLFMDLVPEEIRPRILASLVELLKENNYYLKTGFVGTPYLCRVLSENGYNDIAYRLLLNEEFPSWLYAVKLGATTIWERWNSLLPDGRFGELGMNSLNHYTYGSIGEWMYRHMCGIQPVEAYPGFRKARLAPQPNPALNWARAVLDSAAGRYESGWEYLENAIRYSFAVPFNAEAELELQAPSILGVTVDGRPMAESWVQYTYRSGKLIAVLPPGKYEIICPLEE
ncbi:MAG: family 78 glycoside hydrolase catalytic domain, partial [Bacillota bacterium]|nr:family 78 glycoside hydrolase catalytic domain [Bacillota bacterium]